MTQKSLIEIRYIRGSYQFGRPVLQAQLFNGETRIFDGSVAQVLQHCKEKGYDVGNAQEVLYHICVEQGFAS